MADKTIKLGAVFTADVADFKNKLLSMTAALKKFDDKAKSAANALNKMGSGAAGSSSAAKNMNSQADAFSKAIKGSTAYKRALSALAEAYTRGTMPLKKYLELKAKLDEMFKKGEQAVKNNVSLLDRLSKSLQQIGIYSVSATVIFKFYEALRAGTKEIIEFDQALRNIEAISGGTAISVRSMAEQIKNIARATKFSTGELSEGMVLFAQAGLSAEEAITALKPAADLATGTLSDMKFTTDLITSTMGAFNMKASTAAEMVDIFANAINKSKLTIEKIRTAMNYMGAASAQAGLDLKQTAAAMAVLANNGMRASTIGTGFRQVIARSLNPNRKFRDAIMESGKALEDLNPKTAGFEKSIANLSELLWDAEKNTVDMGKAFKFFGDRGAQAASIMVKSYVKDGAYATMLKKISETGSAVKMAAIQNEGLGVKFKNLVDRAKLAGLALGDAGLARILHILADAGKFLMTTLENLLKNGFVQGAIHIGAFSAALWGLNTVLASNKAAIIAFGQKIALLISNMSLAAAKAKLMAAGMALINAVKANPIVAVTGAIGVLLIALNKIGSRNRRLAEEADMASSQFNRLAEATEDYAAALGKVEPGSEEYHVILKRITDDQPDLAKAIKQTTGVVNIATLSYGKLTETLAGLEKQQLQSAMDKKAEAISRYAEEVRKAQAYMDNANEAMARGGMEGFAMSGKQLSAVQEDLKRTTETYTTAVDELIISLVKQATANANNKEELAKNKESAFRYIESLKLAPPVAEKMRETLTKAFKEMEESSNEASVKMSQSMGKMRSSIEKELASIRSESEKTKDALGKVADEMAGAEKKYYEDMRDIRQTTMSDEQKWLDDREEANRLMNEGIKNQDKEMIAEARNLYKGLAREVKDANGNVVKTAAETADEAKQGVTRAHEATMAMYQKQKDEYIATMKTLEDGLAGVHKKLEEYQEMIAAVSEQKLEIDTNKATDSLEKMRKLLADIRSLQKGESIQIAKLDTTEAEDNLDKLKEKMDDFSEDSETEFNMDFTGEGSSKKPLSEKISEMSDKAKKFASDVSRLNPEIKTEFTGDNGAPMSKAVTDASKSQEVITKIYSEELKKRKKLDLEYAIERSKFWNLNKEIAAKRGIDLVQLEKEANDAKKELYRKDADAKTSAAVSTETKIQKTMEETTEKAVDFKSEMKGKVELDIDTDKAKRKMEELVRLKKEISSGGASVGSPVGMATGGQVPGAGDGDTVPAMLTPGEYVIPKPVVQSVGVDFFHFLRNLQNAGRERISSALSNAAARVRKYASGGLVMPEFRFSMPQMPRLAPVQHFAAGGPVLSAAGAPNFGTVNLTIGGGSYRMWSDEDTARSLMRALDKEQRKKPNK